MMPIANIQRGEASLTLGATVYRLRPSFEALVAAEAEVGSLIALVERAGAGTLQLKDIVVLLHSCALAGGHDVTRDAFAEAVLSEGVAATILPLKTILNSLMGSNAAAD